MARPLRIEFPGALHHVTSRGDGQEPIVLADADRQLLLDVLGAVVERFGWLCHAYCLMTNHYHLLFSPQVVASRATRNERIREATRARAYSAAEIGRHLGLHYSTVAKIAAGHRTPTFKT